MNSNSALLVRCPFCAAGAGFPCKVAGRQRYGFVHPTRREAAEGAPRNTNPLPNLIKEWP